MMEHKMQPADANNEQQLLLQAGPITRDLLKQYRDVSGDPNPLHIDPAAARLAGFPDVIAHGMLSMAFAGRMLTDAYGPTAVRHIKLRFTATTSVGDTVMCTGVSHLVAGGERTVDFKTEAGGNITTTGSARVASTD